MKVSICVPVYGVEKHIERCAKSLFEQTMKDDIEFIFVNDCTPDKSIEILEKVLAEYPSRKNQVKIIHHEQNKGLTGARNTALLNATGDYIIHCDSDDWIDADFCRRLYEVAVENQADVAVCPLSLELADDSVFKRLQLPNGGIESWFAESFHSAEFNSLCNKLFARDIALDPAIRVPDNITMAEDLLRTTQMLLKCSKGVTTDLVCYHYFYGNSGSSTMNYSLKTFTSETAAVEILTSVLPEKYALQRNASLGLLLLSGLCSEGVSLKQLRRSVGRQEHRKALKNPRIALLKRLILLMAYISLAMAKLCCRILLKIKQKTRMA